MRHALLVHNNAIVDSVRGKNNFFKKPVPIVLSRNLKVSKEFYT